FNFICASSSALLNVHRVKSQNAAFCKLSKRKIKSFCKLTGGISMKRQIGTMLLSCVLSAALLGGCAITIAPASEAAAQSTIDNDEPSSSSFPDGPASPTGTPSPTAVEPTPESTRSEPVVYAPGRIADDGDALFEVPDGLDADHFHNFALYLTIAIK